MSRKIHKYGEHYMYNAAIIEMAPFEVSAGITDTQLLDASKQVETGFLTNCEGYIARTLVKTGENTYMDIVYWQTMQAAQAAAEKIFESPACQAYLGCIKMEEGVEPEIKHYDVIGSYSK